MLYLFIWPDASYFISFSAPRRLLCGWRLREGERSGSSSVAASRAKTRRRPPEPRNQYYNVLYAILCVTGAPRPRADIIHSLRRSLFFVVAGERAKKDEDILPATPGRKAKGVINRSQYSRCVRFAILCVTGAPRAGLLQLLCCGVYRGRREGERKSSLAAGYAAAIGRSGGDGEGKPLTLTTLARCRETVLPVTVVVWGVAVPAAVCRRGLCPRRPGVGKCLSGETYHQTRRS